MITRITEDLTVGLRRGGVVTLISTIVAVVIAVITTVAYAPHWNWIAFAFFVTLFDYAVVVIDRGQRVLKRERHNSAPVALPLTSVQETQEEVA